MVGSATQKLEVLGLNGSPEEYTDIKDLLFRKAHKLKNAVVVKSPSFNLFQGTQALEISNDKLDSGLIELTDEEWDFDVTVGRSLKEVCWLGDSVFRSIFTWLNNSSLSVTVFSCRYVEELLVNYTSNPKAGLQACTFSKTDVALDTDEKKLIHQVLRSLILGVLYFVRLGVTFGQGGVVYEEEDINTQTLDLDVLSTISPDEITAEIETSLTFLRTEYSTEKDSIILQNILQILKQLIVIPLLLSIPAKELGSSEETQLASLVENSDILKANLEYLNNLTPIPGCYSLGIQKRLDNKSPTRDLVPHQSEDYSSLELLVADLRQIFRLLHRAPGDDITAFAQSFSHKEHHPFARAFFPLFLIRDDRSVLGDEQFTDYVIKELNQFSCCDSPTFTTDNSVAKNKVLEILNDVSAVYFDYLNSMNQNPCRQRQHLSRAIVLFDSLQANTEQLEMSFESVFQIIDEFEEVPGSNQMTPALPLSSWVFFVKLEIMIEVVLKGFELDIYKIWEYHTMYWYAKYLSDNMLALLKRVVTYNRTKIDRILDMPKKLKKKKAEQKVRYKEKYQSKLQVELPVIEANLLKLEGITTKYKIIQGLCHLQIIHLEQLIHNNLIQTPDFPFIKDESYLYNLRMKPFSTVGAPPFPTYDQYVTGLRQSAKYSNGFKVESNQIRSSTNQFIKQILEKLDGTFGSSYTLCKDYWVEWFKDYQRSCIGISLNLYSEGQTNESHTVCIETERFHRYFPVVRVVKK